MSLIIEKEGKTVEQALEKGLLELGVRREDVEVEIASLGSSGFLGIFGAKPAKIRIKLMPRPKVKSMVETLLEKMGMPGEVRSFREEGNLLIASIDCPTGEKYLKANRGAAIEAMDYLVNKSFRESEYDIRLDIGGFLESQNDDLKNRALELAEKVKQSGKEFEMEPMPPHKRKLVHQALEKHADVKTFAVGNGDRRRVIISLKGAPGAPAEGGRPGRHDRRPAEQQRGPRRDGPRPAGKPAVPVPVKPGPRPAPKPGAPIAPRPAPRPASPMPPRPAAQMAPRPAPKPAAPPAPKPAAPRPTSGQAPAERKFNDRSRRPAPKPLPPRPASGEPRPEAPINQASFAPRSKKKNTR